MGEALSANSPSQRGVTDKTENLYQRPVTETIQWLFATDSYLSTGNRSMATPEFIQLLTGNQSRIYAYIVSLVFDRDQADDILQQTNAVLWEKASEFELGTNFIAWSFRIAYYRVLAHRKQQQREHLIFDETLLRQIAEVAALRDESSEAKHRLLRGCLDKLNARQRDCIRRRYEAGATIESISAQMQMKSNAVKQLLFRARNSLHRCIGKRLESEVAT